MNGYLSDWRGALVSLPFFLHFLASLDSSLNILYYVQLALGCPFTVSHCPNILVLLKISNTYNHSTHFLLGSSLSFQNALPSLHLEKTSVDTVETKMGLYITTFPDLDESPCIPCIDWKVNAWTCPGFDSRFQYVNLEVVWGFDLTVSDRSANQILLHGYVHRALQRWITLSRQISTLLQKCNERRRLGCVNAVSPGRGRGNELTQSNIRLSLHVCNNITSSGYVKKVEG